MHKNCNQCGKSMWINNLKKHYTRKHPDCWDEDRKLYQVCPHCQEFFPEHLGNHVPFCLLNPKRENTLQKFKDISVNRTHSEETKQKISNKRKEWLKENPEKHPWKKHSKFKSQPCEYLKEQLNNKGILFIEEFQPNGERYFSIDIAFPHIKFGIEVNGRQHYDKDFNLKPYYQERQTYLESNGWIVLNIYYSKVYDKDVLNTILNMLNTQQYDCNILSRELELYNQSLLKEEQKKICHCGRKKGKHSLECKKCNSVTRKKYNDEQIQELITQVSIKGFQKYAKELGLSDNALRKRVLRYGHDPKLISPFAHSKNS